MLTNLNFSNIFKALRLIVYFFFRKNSKYPSYLLKFEKKIAREFNYKYALTFSNGTSAAESILRSIDIIDQNVIVPKVSFPSIICTILRNRANIIYIDIDYDFQIVIDDNKELIKNNNFLLITNAYGFTQNENTLKKIKKINPNIKIIEDNSHSAGAKNINKITDQFDVDSFMSMQGEKAISAGEGGIAFTNSPEIYKKMILNSHINRSEKEFDKTTNNLSKIGFGLKSRMHPFGVLTAEYDLDNLEKRNKKIRQNIKIIYDKINNSKIYLPKVVSYENLGGFHYGIPFFIEKKFLSKDLIDKYNLKKYNWPALDNLKYFSKSYDFLNLKSFYDLDDNLYYFNDMREKLYFFDLNFIKKLNKHKINKFIEEFNSEI